MSDVEICYKERTYRVYPGETVLESLERAGIFVPSSCRAGVCQSCLLKSEEGTPPPRSQEGLKPQLKASGHFLACICRPQEYIKCAPAHTADFRGNVTIKDIKKIGKNVALVRFHKPDNFNYTPGQFVTLTLRGGLSRSYSIATYLNSESYFDIHVRHIEKGRMSTWFHSQAQKGDRLWMEGPKGECTYNPGHPNEPLTLIGTGTGIAPLYAIAKDALENGHSGPIALYQGALKEESLYFEDEIENMAASHSNIRYVRCVLHKSFRQNITYGDLKDIALSELTDANTRRIYLCGDPGLVRILKKSFFLAGVSIKKIHADPFVVSEHKK